MLLGNDLVAVGDDFVCCLEVAEDLDGLVSSPLDDRMVLDHHHGADDSLLPGDSTPRGRGRVISHHQGRLCPGCAPGLALTPTRLAEQPPSEGLVSGESHHHGLCTALQAHCKYQAKTPRTSHLERKSQESKSSHTKPTSWRSEA